MEPLIANRGGGAGKGRLKRFSRDRNGTTAVEFAFIAPIFIALLLAILQTSVIFFAQSYLASVVDATARAVLTNQTASLTPAQFKSMLCANATAMFTCSQFIVSLQPAPSTSSTTTAAQAMSSALPTFNAAGTLTSTPPIDTIPACHQALLIVMYQWPVIAGPLGTYFGLAANNSYLLTATEVFQTEPSTVVPVGCAA